VKKKTLELLLQRIKPVETPLPKLEQYITPASIAADILYIAYGFGDIKSKKVIDFGCGTGIFAIGAAILGAEKCIGIDVDSKCIECCKKNLELFNLGSAKIKFITCDIENFYDSCDTVIQNPPFGAQKTARGMDVKFIEKSMEIGKVVYSIHQTTTLPFIKRMLEARDVEIDFSKDYRFEIKYMFEFHKKRRVFIDVTLLRILP
jgi:putative methylase